ncbi:MAG TPA: SRPBCC domain-containing protein [Vicinamibacteria bacterium]|jgi:uncharacterized protein YndB with AHSA1/START domain
MTARSLPEALDRTILIEAAPETVFRFFTDPARWAAWWGAGSTVDARPGGRVFIRYPEGTEASGEVIEVAPPHRIVFTYGYVSGKPIPPGGSRVTIRLEPAGMATRLHLLHEFAEASVRDHHVQGWRYQLAVFGNVVADEVHAGAGGAVDGWFAAWSEPDVARREAAFARVAAPQVRFRDRYSLVDGAADLLAHVAAAQRFMPGIRLQREGEVRHCQGTVLADWIARGAGGQERGRGTNVFVFDAAGRIESATGFWNAPAPRS